jgi:hypothetical protein
MKRPFYGLGKVGKKTDPEANERDIYEARGGFVIAYGDAAGIFEFA